jgi:hypothetical protein
MARLQCKLEDSLVQLRDSKMWKRRRGARRGLKDRGRRVKVTHVVKIIRRPRAEMLPKRERLASLKMRMLR